MSKSKPFGRAKKTPAKPKADDPPKVENPPAQPEWKDMTVKEELVNSLTPAKPSEEVEAVKSVLVGCFDIQPGDDSYEVTIDTFAAAIVRRFPGLTRKPGLPRHAYEDARMAKRGRLPDGSIVLEVWNQEEGRWTGWLVTAPRVGLADMLSRQIELAGAYHRDQHTGLFGLLKRLDSAYREWLGRQKK